MSWIVMGLLVGALGRLFIPGKDPMGCMTTLAFGIAGAAAGGFVGSLLGFGSVEGFDLRSLVLATLGAVALLLVRRAMKKDEESAD